MKTKATLLGLTVAGLMTFVALAPISTQSAPKNGGSGNNLEPDAELLALEASGALLAPLDLYIKIHVELEDIRGAFPVVYNIHARANWVWGQLICVPLTSGQRNCLNSQNLGPYSLSRVRWTSSYQIITFSQHYNPDLLSAFLRANCGIVSGPNHYGGDGNDITYDLLTGLYTFKMGWGDCEAGCISNHYWLFSVNAVHQVTLISEYGSPLP